MIDEREPGDRLPHPGEGEQVVRRGSNVGDPDNPRAANALGLYLSSNHKAIRISLHREDSKTSMHLSLTVDGMEKLAYDILVAVDKCKQELGIKDN